MSLNVENGEAQHYLARMYWKQADLEENKKDLCFQTLLKVSHMPQICICKDLVFFNDLVVFIPKD